MIHEIGAIPMSYTTQLKLGISLQDDKIPRIRQLGKKPRFFVNEDQLLGVSIALEGFALFSSPTVKRI